MPGWLFTCPTDGLTTSRGKAQICGIVRRSKILSVPGCKSGRLQQLLLKHDVNALGAVDDLRYARSKKAPPSLGRGLWMQAACFRAASSSSGDDRHDLERDGVHDHDFLLEDEEAEATEPRYDDHDILRNHEQLEAPRNHDADADIEGDVGHAEARYEVLAQHNVVDPSPLLGRERDVALDGSLRSRRAGRRAGAAPGRCGRLRVGTDLRPRSFLGTGLGSRSRFGTGLFHRSRLGTGLFRRSRLGAGLFRRSLPANAALRARNLFAAPAGGSRCAAGAALLGQFLRVRPALRTCGLLAMLAHRGRFTAGPGVGLRVPTAGRSLLHFLYFCSAAGSCRMPGSAASCRLTGGSTLRSDALPATRRTLMHAGSAAGGRSVL